MPTHEAEGTAVPPWFTPALAAALVPLIRTAHLTYNLQCADGRNRTFKIVPFVNGEDPTGQPHNLPQLRGVDDIDALTDLQVMSYLRGYNVQHIPNTIPAQKRAICVEIGSSCLPSF